MVSKIAIKAEPDSLYAKQPKIYPREIDGPFQRLRTAAVFWLLGMFYVFPWLTWDEHQIVLFDLPARKFYIFGLTFWPQDFFFLTWLLIMAALSLFFFTALAGRLWCGYACPQTVWTEVFLWLERFCEGTRNKRMKLDIALWNREKFLRKSAKQFLWIIFALWTGFTFVGLFTPIRQLANEIATFELGGWETFWMLFYGLATYGNAGYLREQVCKYMCPYARFQGAMFDRDTLIVSYDEARGERRGSRRRNSTDYKAFGLGDCIDCGACVQVCPTGIDIREGLQMECIACAGCIDACNGVMDKMGYARGLIRYTTENMLGGKPQRVIRPRTLIYASSLSSLLIGFVWTVTHRPPLIVDVLRDRNALYRETNDGSIENSYTLKLINKTNQTQHYRVIIDSSLPIAIVGNNEIDVSPSSVGNLPLTLRSAGGNVQGMQELRLQITSESAVKVAETTRFFAPGRHP